MSDEDVRGTIAALKERLKVKNENSDFVVLDAGVASVDPAELSELELNLILGGYEPGYNEQQNNPSGNAWDLSNQATQEYNNAQQENYNHLTNAIEAAGNLEFGTATRELVQYFDNSGIDQARANLEYAVDHDVQMNLENQGGYTPSDGNMTNRDGSVGVGQ